ncbi:uncharacterized protein FTOL_12130 [Fusarium torulosum]|uniref:Uncharacterized protein n=1 Tax=Fusarium torulosum TaxID=33205 RepID=A0AAE8MK17_9HYPO|nr:uncharacterized protein FTOL_12130 [Fusarium torulosum]
MATVSFPSQTDCLCEVDYSFLNREADLSELVTSQVFTNLRGSDGLPVSEREIFKHPWLAFDYSDDDKDIDDNENINGEKVEGSTLMNSLQNVRNWMLDSSSTGPS